MTCGANGEKTIGVTRDIHLIKTSWYGMMSTSRLRSIAWRVASTSAIPSTESSASMKKTYRPPMSGMARFRSEPADGFGRSSFPAERGREMLNHVGFAITCSRMIRALESVEPPSTRITWGVGVGSRSGCAKVGGGQGEGEGGRGD